MGSGAPLKLPTIDFSRQNLKPGTIEWDSVRARVRFALEEYGCFEALFNKVPSDVRKGIFEATEELFDLPLQTKLRNVSQKPFHGYVGQYPVVPVYESMCIEEANVYGQVQSFTNIFWPQQNPNFSKTVHSFSEKLSELDQIIRRMILESLGLEKYLEEHIGSTNYLLQVMKYKGPQTSETKPYTHTDKNIVTILHQNQVEGLEVQTKDGKWINVKPSPESFIAMIGDSLDAWTNGRLHCPHHRHPMTGNEAKYSTALFSFPKAGYIIKAPEEVVDEEHPLLFKPFDNVEFLGFCFSEAGQRAQSALKTYCGVEN
ncbi:probable 2-oxoglutarate-dependent dioxygenase AOP1 [Rosa rugosa]|uniref:probable 2-oxoglutarate-dependent dioxygenase AOP1 n=1 Tax=Rosa rugosa TaxID=74645 RepID=UPI002B40AA3A|nr:probable 2-oxoglutarate-dependent dioxygenase AOP1 [Rosa rugosa]